MQRGGWVASGWTGFLLRVSSLNCALAHKKKRLASVFSTGTNNLLNALKLNSAIQLWLCMKLLCVYLCLGPTEVSRTRCMAVMFKGGVTFPQSSLCRKQRMKKHLHCHLLGALRRLQWLDLSSPAVPVCAMSCKDGMCLFACLCWQEGDGAQAGPCWLLTPWSLLAACYGVWGAMVQAEMWCPVVNEP